MFRQLSALVLLVVFLAWVNADDDIAGLPLEGFSPCKGGELYMERLIGRPKKDENYWNGTVYLDEYSILEEVRITVVLDHRARVSIDKKIGRVYGGKKNVFFISTYAVPPEIDEVNFVVKGKEDEPFPNVVSLQLNGRDICPEPEKWEPAFLSEADIKEFETAAIETAPRLPSRTETNCQHIQVHNKEQGLDGSTSKPGEEWPFNTTVYRYASAYQTTQDYTCGGNKISATFVIAEECSCTCKKN